MNPASNTTTPVALLTRIRVCSLHLIGHACFERSRPAPVDELRGITIKVGGTGAGARGGRLDVRPARIKPSRVRSRTKRQGPNQSLGHGKHALYGTRPYS